MEEFTPFRKEGAQGYIDDNERLSKERYVKFGSMGFYRTQLLLPGGREKTRGVLSFPYILSLVPSP